MNILHKTIRLACAALLAFSVQTVAFGQAKTFTAGNLTYTENFDGMGTVIPSVYPTGWTANNNGGTTLVLANPNDGSTGSGSIVNLGVAGINALTDRALGTIASGSVAPHFGASFANNTGSSISAIALTGFMEQWKAGNNAVVETVVFEYSTDATSLSTGTWTAATGMNLVEKLTADNLNAKKDGNDAANRTSISASVTGLSWSNGSNLWIRWKDVNDTGNDGIYAIDDFNMAVTLAAACTPTKLAITSVAPTSPVQNQLFSVTVQSQSAGSTSCNLAADATVTLSGIGIGGVTTGTITAGTSTITINNVSLSQAGSITVTAAGGGVTNATTSITVQEAANQLTFGTMPTSGFAGNAITSFSVRAVRNDASTDATYAGSITLSKASGPGTISGTLTRTAASGVVNFNDIIFSAAGTYTLSVTGTSLSGSTTSSSITIASGPTFTELVVPQYIGAINVITPIAIALRVSNLTPNTSYDVRLGLDSIGSLSTSYGAGSIWGGASFGGTNPTNVFTTDASGNSGIFWIYVRPSTNPRFIAGKNFTIRVSAYPNGSSAPIAPMFVGTKQIKTLDLASTAATGTTADDGAYIKVTNLLNDYSGKYVLIYDNVNGTGNPLYAYQCATTTPVNGSQTSLPATISEAWQPANGVVAGDYAAAVPMNNANGVRRIEVRNANNTIAYVLTDADGVWYNGTNTTTLTRRAVGLIAPSCAVITDVDTVAVGATIIDIAWTPSPTNSLGYEIQWRTGTNPWNGPGRLSATSSTYRIPSLIPNTLYTYRFRSVCTMGGGPWVSKTITTLSVPSCSAPVPSVSSVGASVADISWTVAGGTSGISSYEVQWQTVGGLWNGSGKLSTPSLAAYRIPSLTPGVTYNYRVRSLCSSLNEWTDWSNGSFTTNAVFACSTPTFILDSIGATAVDVSWTPTSNTSAYEIQWQTVGGAWNGPGRFNNPMMSAYRIPSLLSGTTYNYRMRSLCTANNEWSSWTTSTFTTNASAVCSSPSSVSVTPGASFADLSWTPTTATSAYEIQWQTAGGAWNGPSRFNNALLSAYRIPNLAPSTLYNYRIRSLCVAMNEWASWTTGTFTTLAGGGRLGSNSLSINIFPNPSSGLITISGVEKANYIVFNALGQQVIAGELSTEATLDLRNQNSGIYLLKVISGDVVTTKQIVINR